MSFLQQFLLQAKSLEGGPEPVAAENSGPSLQATSGFNPATDAANLDKAITGVDEGTIIKLLTKRTNSERQQIKAAYQQQTGKRLDDELNKALSGHLEEVVLAMMKTPAQYDAHCLKNAIKGPGTDESTLVEILVTRGNREIREIDKAYKEEFKTDLANDVASDTSGDFQKVLLVLVKGERNESAPVNNEQADNDARALSEARDTAIFINILSSRSFIQLQLALNRFASNNKNQMAKATDLQMKGDVENTLISLAKVASSKPTYFAERFKLSMKGPGTRPKDLIRLLVSRNEIDLKEIKYLYKKLYGKSLRQAIKEQKLKEVYETIMMSLCGPDN
ncbi:annexin A1-like [Rana temporaria]|uniref:annexin A1-like n=1 Tax=Rana temporaria TaxID=8407 RepID=UPI001AAD6613|nr:annexin A1-like [Rana temporaria]XP_040212262.1 annexin A1-like [Rana temporaria]XP_040212272.1 annexin A1-like [Rana temporaria]